MKTRKKWLAWMVLMVAIVAWCGYGYEILMLSQAREAYAAALDEKQQDDVRGAAALKLHTLIENSHDAEAKMEAQLQHPILDVVTTIEKAGKDAGAKNVTIGEAIPVASPAKGISAFDVVVVSEGSYATMVRAEAMFEKLPLVSQLQQFGLEKIADTWHLTARIRIYVNQQ